MKIETERTSINPSTKTFMVKVTLTDHTICEIDQRVSSSDVLHNATRECLLELSQKITRYDRAEFNLIRDLVSSLMTTQHDVVKRAAYKDIMKTLDDIESKMICVETEDP